MPRGARSAHCAPHGDAVVDASGDKGAHFVGKGVLKRFSCLGKEKCAGFTPGLLSTLSILAAPLTVLCLLLAWQAVCSAGLVPPFMLPSPVSVAQALVTDWPLLASHAATSLAEAGLGLGAGVALGFVVALAMDRFELLYRAFYPIVVLTQTIPTVAIAPLLVLWFGYGMLPKVVLIVVTTFFPITVGLLEGLRSVDPDEIDLMRAMGASRWQIMRHAKLPAALPQDLGGLRHRGRRDRRMAGWLFRAGRVHDARAQGVFVRQDVRGDLPDFRVEPGAHVGGRCAAPRSDALGARRRIQQALALRVGASANSRQ